VNDHLQQLVRLQDLMQAIEAVEARIAAVPICIIEKNWKEVTD